MGIKFYDSNGKYWGEYDETRSLFIPSEETITQTETQNSNLTFEKADEPQTCDTCKYGEDKHRYAHICNECGVGINNYEPKDECAKEYEELGLKELKELIEADRKTEPSNSENPNNSTISKMEQVDKPQADCGDFADRLAYERGVKHAWEVAQKVFGSTVTFYEAEDVARQIDKDINVRSKESE